MILLLLIITTSHNYFTKAQNTLQWLIIIYRVCPTQYLRVINQ